MGRYGVEISQQGIPVDRAADYQKVLDSNWKFLDIAFEVDIDIKIGLSGVPNGFHPIEIFTHNLGYLPAFELIPSPLSKEYTAYNNVLFSGYAEALRLIRADNQKVYANILYNGNNIEMRLVGKLRVFALDILNEYTAPTIPVTTTSKSPQSRYGAKFLDLNKGKGDIDDEALYPFTLNTRGKQMSVHKHGTQRTSSGLLTITHNVGYPPTYMICKLEEKSNWGGYYPYPFKTDYVVGSMVTAYYLAKLTPTTIQFKGVQASLQGLYGYIILKDPAEIAG